MGPQGGEYPPEFQRGYTWVILALEATNTSIEPALAAMRLLGLQQQRLLAQPKNTIEEKALEVSVKCELHVSR